MAAYCYATYIADGYCLSFADSHGNRLVQQPNVMYPFALYVDDPVMRRFAKYIAVEKGFLEDAASLYAAVTRQLLRDFRLYMLVGGMPQAVSKYIETNDLGAVDAIKREILELYADDFRKIDPTGKATKMFYAIPGQLNSNATRYQLSSVVEQAKKDRVEEIIQDMEDSQVVMIAHHSNDPNVGLPLHEDSDRYKMYLNDTGLFITLAFRDKDITENVIYQKLLNDKLSADLGYVYENVVAQMLKASGNELFYHTCPTESGKHNYEIDFLLSRGSKVYPIEVKSSGYKTHASLDAFMKKYPERTAQGYLLYTKDMRKDSQILLTPVFMTMFL